LQLFAETQGRVISVGAEELDRVEADQVLLRIDPLLAEVAVEQAQARVARRRSELLLAQSNLKRRSSLADRGAASGSALEDAISVEQVAQAALRESLAEVRRAQDDLTKKVIRAPLAGVLRSFDVEEGEYVRSGQPLGELLDLEQAKVRIGLSDREVVAVRSGQAVRMQLEAYPEETFQGEIARVGAAWDVDTRKFPVEIEIDNPDGRLLPGMIAEVSFYLGEASTVQVIPRDAALKEFGLRFVYVVASAPDGSQLIARKRRITVRPMPFRPAEFEVLTGLSDGEEIATSGVSGLHDGDAVSRIGDAG
jgi:RND family efflux transporter MFP subunit